MSPNVPWRTKSPQGIAPVEKPGPHYRDTGIPIRSQGHLTKEVALPLDLSTRSIQNYFYIPNILKYIARAKDCLIFICFWNSQDALSMKSTQHTQITLEEGLERGEETYVQTVTLPQ